MSGIPTVPLMTRVGAGTVRHYVGARVSRITYEGVWEDTDGVRHTCGHHGHPTVAAAAKCAAKAAKRSAS